MEALFHGGFSAEEVTPLISVQRERLCSRLAPLLVTDLLRSSFLCSEPLFAARRG